MRFWSFSHILQKLQGHQNLIKSSACPSVTSMQIWSTRYEPQHEIFHNLVCVTSKGSDQPAHRRSLIRAFASHLNILYLTAKETHNFQYPFNTRNRYQILPKMIRTCLNGLMRSFQTILFFLTQLIIIFC